MQQLSVLQVGNGVSKVFAQAVYDPPGREDFLQQTFTYLGRPGGRRPPVRFDQLDGDADGKVLHGLRLHSHPLIKSKHHQCAVGSELVLT